MERNYNLPGFTAEHVLRGGDSQGLVYKSNRTELGSVYSSPTIVPQACICTPCINANIPRICANIPLIGRKCINLPSLGRWKLCGCCGLFSGCSVKVRRC